MQRWTWLLVLIGGGLVAYSSGGGRLTLQVGLVIACVVLLAWWLSPLSHGKSKKMAAVMALPAEDRRVVIYWRPGCMFCQRLRGALGRQGRGAQWINIWQDDEAAAFVRSVNGGNEVVPTVVIDDVPHTNPDPALVKTALAA
ncbi:glutaredoxin domain-containing protein [Tessaracoccus defluvii]|nr:glutaredoxin domain-containing protein [Tessaracoccus defluvii]